jgi:PAS domain S-box-containing protein
MQIKNGQRANMQTIFTRNSIKTRVTAAMLGIFSIGIWSLFFYTSQILRLDMERLLGEQQSSAVSFMAEEVNQELSERIEALEIVAATIDSDILAVPEKVETFLTHRVVLKSFFNAGLHILRAEDRASTDDIKQSASISIEQLDQATLQAVVSKGKTQIGQPLFDPILKQPVFSIATPIFDARGKIAGTLVGTTNLGKANFLDKISASQNNKNSQYHLLIAPQHRLIVTSSDKKRVMETIPGPGVNPLIDRFIQGYEGTAMIINPMNLEVLSTAKSIPAAGWLMVISLPSSEAFAPIRNMQRRILLSAVLLTLLAGGFIYWVLKREFAPLTIAAKKLSEMSEKNQRPHALSLGKPDEIGKLISSFNQLLHILQKREDTLGLSEKKLSTILENVDANIYLKDKQGRYLFANRSVCKVFGASKEQIIGQSDEVFFDAKTVKQLRLHEHQVLVDGATFRQEEHTINLKNGQASTYLSVKLPLRDATGEIYALCGISTDITERKKSEQELRIAAIAFDCQEGIIVMDVNMIIVKVNQAFTKITGYSQQDVQGKTTAILRSDRQAFGIYQKVQNDLRNEGAWSGEMWRRRKNGDDYFAQGAISAVRDEQARVTHYVTNFTDITGRQLHEEQEQQRLRNEIAHRDVLVREVHHRIKNNLQGITGILRQFAQKYPEIADPANQAISQVHSISVIYGLQGRADASVVRLSELTCAIADEIQSLWKTALNVDVSGISPLCLVSENEAVPIALILNELLLNAVKHGGQAHGYVSITLQNKTPDDLAQAKVDIVIANAGQYCTTGLVEKNSHNGLQLVEALMPPYGATLTCAQRGEHVITTLELSEPVIFNNKQEFT